jgi:uncharacterized protein (DUF2141 family)
MRWFVAPLALALLTGCFGATIEGKVVVGEGQEGLTVYAALWRDDVGKSNPADFVTVEAWPVGTATKAGGRFDYSFLSVSKGRYVVGAFADRGADGAITDDAFVLNVETPLEVDPNVPSLREHTQDIFLATSRPGRATLAGTLHAGPGAAALSVQVLALDRPIEDPSARVMAGASLAPGVERPFRLFDVPSGPVHLVAIADVGGDGQPANDLYALHPGNPLTLEADRVPGAIDLWLGAQAPDLGRMAGTLTLNAALPNLRVQLLALSSSTPAGAAAPVLASDARVEAIVNVDLGGRASADFVMPSLKRGVHFLAASLETTDPDGTRLSASRVHTKDGQEVGVDTERPESQSLTFGLGVGRCSGTIRLHGAPGTMTTAGLFALVPGGVPRPGQLAQPVIHDVLVVPARPVNGEVVATYRFFGLEDGRYDLSLIPDLDGDGSYQSEYEARRVYASTPAQVTVTGGGRVAADVEATLSR